MIGDDKARFPDACGLKAYAGASLTARASGKKSSIARRRVKNDRLNHAGHFRAFSLITVLSGAKAHCERRRDAGDWHAAVQRNLFNFMLGQLYRCLQQNELFDEKGVFPCTADGAPESA
ncbi:hypothetical protein [Streptomyces sp. NPDC003688]